MAATPATAASDQIKFRWHEAESKRGGGHPEGDSQTPGVRPSFVRYSLQYYEPPVFPDFQPGQRDNRHDENRADAAGHDGHDCTRRNGIPHHRPAQVSYKTGLESVQLIRLTDEKAVNDIDAPAFFIQREQLHQGLPHHHADIVHRAAGKQHGKRKPKPAGKLNTIVATPNTATVQRRARAAAKIELSSKLSAAKARCISIWAT